VSRAAYNMRLEKLHAVTDGREKALVAQSARNLNLNVENPACTSVTGVAADGKRKRGDGDGGGIGPSSAYGSASSLATPLGAPRPSFHHSVSLAGKTAAGSHRPGVAPTPAVMAFLPPRPQYPLHSSVESLSAGAPRQPLAAKVAPSLTKAPPPATHTLCSEFFGTDVAVLASEEFIQRCVWED
jgi:hypothetical protein